MQFMMIDDAQGAEQFRNSIVADISSLPRPSTHRIDQKPIPSERTDYSSQIVITVTPDERPGRYRAYTENETKPLCRSRQPFLDSARKLIASGHNFETILAMRWAGAKNWALRSSLGAAAKLTVDEHNGTFAKWKPYSRSAVPPKIAKSATRHPTAGSLTKQCLRAPPRKGSELSPGRADRAGSSGCAGERTAPAAP